MAPTVATCVPERLRVPLSPPQAVSETSGLLWRPAEDRDRAGLVLAPGAGTDLSALAGLGRSLAASGYPMLVFNFGYREAGRRRPDPVGRLGRAFTDAIACARARLGADRPLVLGGRSMGGRIASQLAAADNAPSAGLVLLSYPLHPRQRAGQAPPEERLRVVHWPEVRVPVLFVQGDRDPLCDLDLLERERRARLTAAPSEVHVIAGADHSLAVGGRAADDVLGEVVAVVTGWLARLP